MNHPITPLASAQVNHDHLKVELVEPDSLPAMVRIGWPPQPTVVDPKRFPDVAATVAQLLREHTSCWPQSERSGDSNRATLIDTDKQAACTA